MASKFSENSSNRATRRIGKHPVVATDTPGFVVNHAGRAYGPEALRIVAQGIASPREVDLLMKEAAGFRMGPFELLDLIGADVTHAVMVSIYEQYFGEPMYQPSAQLAARVAGGLLGRKTKQGFYNYDGPPAASPPTIAVAARPKPASAWIAACTRCGATTSTPGTRPASMSACRRTTSTSIVEPPNWTSARAPGLVNDE